MKTWMAALVLGCALTMPAAPAAAFDGVTFSMQGQGFGGGRGHPGGGRGGHQPREARAVQPPPSPPPAQARGQLSPEERRQLHLDLDKANREIYRGKR